MKKFLAMLLALAMVLSLAACGSSSASSDTAAAEETAEPAAEETAEPAAEEAAEPAAEETADAPAEDAAAEETADFGDVANDPAITLTCASAFTSTQLPGMFWEYLKSDIEELSGGSITLDLYLGGTLGGSDEEMGMLTNGSVDMIMTFLPSNAFITSPIESIYYTPSDIETAQQIMNYIFFEDEASAAVVADSFAAQNATLLPAFVVTSDIVFATTQDASSFSDLYTGKFGCPMDANYTDMGFQNLVTVTDADWYESLRTGLCDTVQATAADVVSSKIYEVAKNYIVCPANRVDHLLTINTDTLNSMTENQQAVLYQACADLLAYSAETENDLYSQFEEVVTSNGGTIYEMSDEDFEWFMYCGNILGWRSGLETLAVMTDCVDQMTIVQEATKAAYNQYTDYDFDALAEKYDG